MRALKKLPVLRTTLTVFTLLCLGWFSREGLETRNSAILRAEPASPLASNTEPQTLHEGEKVSDVLSAGEARLYVLDLPTGQHADVEIGKGDLQLVVSICDASGQGCLKVSGLGYGPLRFSVSADVTRTYRIEVKSLESELVARPYELLVRELASATPQRRFKDDAFRALAEADDLRRQPLEAAQRRALAKYSEATSLWQSAGESGRQVEALCSMGNVYFVLSDYKLSLSQYVKALDISEAKRDEAGMLEALNGIGYAYVYLSDNEKATAYARKMLEIVGRTDPNNRPVTYKRAEAQAINTLGEVDYSLGELRKSIESFERAQAIYLEVGDRDGQALSLLNLGYSHSDLGNAQKASKYFESALKLFQSINDGRGVALAQTVLGGTHSLSGEEQIALALHREAGEYFRAIGNKQGEAAALNGVARAYQNLNEFEAALDNFKRALQLYEEIANRGFVALNKFLIGRIFYQRGDVAKAEQFYKESMNLSRAVGDQVVEAHSEKGLGTIYFSRGNVPAALARFDAALAIYRKLGNRRSEAYVLNDIGHIQTATGQLSEALDNLQRGLLLMRDTGDRHGEALTLFNAAKAERSRGDLAGALASIQEAVAISELLRTRINNSQLRTSYFASVQDQFELYINILMSLHNQYPNRGYNAAALLASERARARSLLDSLQAEQIEFRAIPSADLLSRQQELGRALDEKAEYQTRLLAGNHTHEDADKLSQEINALTLELQDVRSKLRRESPRRAFLTQSDQLQAGDLQNLVRGEDALLLEFALGDEKSYLWAVTATNISSYELPARAQIEALAEKVYESITMRQSPASELPAAELQKKISEADVTYGDQSAALSRMLLGPIGSSIGSKRLLIVGDGLLRFIPFEALPLPASSVPATDSEPLVSAHEIVILPSALTLAALRSERNKSSGASKTIAVIADPVFEKDDPRVESRESKTTVGREGATFLATALRDFSESGGGQGISRLPSTLREGKAIMDFVSPGDGVMRTGFDATKQRFVGDRMNDYRIIHLATHGLLNNEHPDLSGVVLSLVDEHGNSVDGFLRLHDIYSLDLSANLVVLSACRTGLGKNIRGEGAVGLSSGFMYAGAKSVVASLWKVDDNATADFMNCFYTAILRDGQPPAAALRAAKLEMRKQGRWHQPFYWAGFVLQGEYRDEVQHSSHLNRRWLLIIITLLTLSIIAVYLGFRRKHERRAGPQLVI